MGTAFLVRGSRVRCIVPSHGAVSRAGMAPGAATRLKSIIFKVPLGATVTFCGLRSPAHETCGVHGGQPGGDLRAHGAGRIHWKWTVLRHEIRHSCYAGDELHHEVLHRFPFTDVVHGRDVGRSTPARTAVSRRKRRTMRCRSSSESGSSGRMTLRGTGASDAGRCIPIPRTSRKDRRCTVPEPSGASPKCVRSWSARTITVRTWSLTILGQHERTW